jgi:hypothetical protein
MIGSRRSIDLATRSMRRLGFAGFLNRGFGSAATIRIASRRLRSAALL